MVMIEQYRYASAHSRKSILANHNRKHLHLTSLLHLRHTAHTGASFRKVDSKSVSPPLPVGILLQNGLMQQLSTLQNRSCLRDPPVSPSCQSNGGNAAAQLLPLACSKFAEQPKHGSFSIGAPQQTRKTRRKRARRTKFLLRLRKNGAMNTGGSACSSSMRSTKCLPSDRPVTFPCKSSTHNLVQTSKESPNGKKSFLSGGPHGCISTKPATSKVGVSATSGKGSVPILNSLSVKYAPRSFADILGQHIVTYALLNTLHSRRVAPTYIFYGPHGTGKTSCAKLFAFALNCLAIEKNRPCWTCRLCLAQTSGKFFPITEVKSGAKGLKTLMKDLLGSPSFLYRVCIVEDCHSLSSKAWSILLKGIKAASKKTVFIFNTVSLEHIPHVIMSQCQKFHFSNISERDIISKLQMISIRESLTVDVDAFELIASKCNGSLYDAELMLDRCCCCSEKVTVPIVEDLVGLISDSRLLALLDSALSAERTKTVHSLKAFVDSGIEPVNVLSQLASLITRILAGGYHIPRWEQELKFFCRRELTKDETQRLRQALRILSEAEKQLQGSSCGATWLISALLQFAPDKLYRSSSGVDRNLFGSPIRGSMGIKCNVSNPSKLPSTVENQSVGHFQFHANDIVGINNQDFPILSAPNPVFNKLQEDLSSRASQSQSRVKETPSFEAESPIREHNNNVKILRKQSDVEKDDLQQLWQRVLDAINSTNLKCFLQEKGKLVAIYSHEDSKEAVLEFHRLEHLSRVQRSKASILHAFHTTLGHHVKVRAHLVSSVNEGRRSSSSIQAAKVGQSVPGKECGVSSFCSSNGNTGFRHEKSENVEPYEACERQFLSERVPAHVVQSQVMDTLSLEKGERGGRENMSQHILCDDIDKHIVEHDAMNMDSRNDDSVEEKSQYIGLSSFKKFKSLSCSTEKAAGGVEGRRLGLQYFTLGDATLRRDSTEQGMCVETEKGKTSAMVVAKLQEENL